VKNILGQKQFMIEEVEEIKVAKEEVSWARHLE
jgi:hypothetical protein